ncbi:MAG: ABC transporter substrate-binding protein [Eubacteriales bacterium]|nr:ABC transporter substrate-binding protein [Eubacteriales bacterium]
MKKIMAMLMAAVMMTTAVGCSRNGGDSSDAQAEAVQGETAQGDPEEITVRFMCFGTVPTDLAIVEEAINELTIPAINVKVNYEAISASNYSQQIALDMTSGEELDVFYGSTYTSMVSSNQLMDLSPYLEAYGQEITAALGEDWLKATSVGDSIYAIPVLNGKASSLQIAMRTDILEKYGLTTDFEMNEDITDEGMIATIEEITDILEVVKENEPEMIVMHPAAGVGTLGLESMINYDSLTDGLGVLMGNDGWTVENLYETDEFYQALQIARDWYEAGYIKADAATDTESYTSYAQAGRLFSFFQISEEGADTSLKASTGYDYTCVKIKTPLITSTSLSNMFWGVSSTSEKPEASVKFLNMAYSDKDLANLLCYGVEGTHWQYTEEGTVAYADGLDASTSGYPFTTYWEMPSHLIADPLEGNPIDYNERLLNNNKTAKVSRAIGFAFDQDPVKTEVSAVSAVLSEYGGGLLTGSLDLESNYPTFIQKLKDAGIDTIIAEKQSQLDTWREENGV